ncbi:hypothetical protein DS885_03940 [Psychromonas sp. B3M02]|uniref:hypothetical protein n=1 Tax=Psychromonas sp. B3M02 TaxID=2267226 RepID=UPI000DEBE5E4|nr:hypothetical protein [Psychromonas sp. B3M02]RBW47308.1 hypothetical protein DS885_03940 [Psychromonas sp. B3M02]
MYHRFKLFHGVILISDKLVNDINYLFNSVAKQVVNQQSPEDVIAFIADLFDVDSSINSNGYNEDKICKLAVVILNLRLAYFDDLDIAVEEFNQENLPLTVGTQEGAFYPSGIGHWYDQLEFVFIPRDKLEPFDSIDIYARI